jgi:hypothetical protein
MLKQMIALVPVALAIAVLIESCEKEMRVFQIGEVVEIRQTGEHGQVVGTKWRSRGYCYLVRLASDTREVVEFASFELQHVGEDNEQE